ncbi:MAG: TIM barrel protein [Saprospiraceae bacterium]|nr:TIM barrel protein [Saprospiraceae bacterium]MBK8669864.1 TIM barrel protein [Saprospiraceae bacterium]
MSMTRRNLIKSSILGAGGLLIGDQINSENKVEDKGLENNIHHSVCHWTYNHISLDELCLLVKKIGFSAIDLVGPKDWSVLKRYNVDSSMCNGAEIGLTKGWNDKQYHDQLVKNYSEHIDLVSSAGYKNLICFSGNRDGKDDESGMQTCVEGLKKILLKAEKKGVVIQMELFNSKIDHKDYMCDSSAWGIELCKRLDSPNFKLLYDIYHMQINEGDIIRTIKEHFFYFGHYHTAGVPGRHEIDESQELYYPAIMKAILQTGYKGYVAQEFIPTAKTNIEKEKALRKAIKTCDV